MAFATAQNLRDRYDVRVIGKYASDTGVPVPAAALSTNPRILAALRDATAVISAACVKGGRYPTATLNTLAADPDAGALLHKMTCALAMASLIGGRVGGVDEIDEVVHGYKDALENLNDLRNGSIVFDLPDTITATLPESSAGPPFPDRNRPTNYNPMFGWFEYRV